LKKTIRYFLIIVLSFIVLVTGTSLIAGFIYGDKIKSLIIAGLSKQLNITISVNNVSFSFLKRFPNATVVLKDVFAGPSAGFDKSAFLNYNTDTLISAKSVILEFNALDIFRKNYILRKIGIDRGKLRLFAGKDNNSNFDIWNKSDSSSTSGFSLELKKVSLEDIDIIYADYDNNLAMRTFAKDMALQGRFNGDDYSLRIKSEMYLAYLIHDNKNICTTGNLNTAFNLDVKSKSYRIEKGKLSFEDNRFDISLFYEPVQNGKTDLLINGEDINIHSLIRNIPSEYAGYFEPYEINGYVSFNFRLKGEAAGSAPFHTESDFSVKEGSLLIKKQNIKLSRIGITGYYTSGKNNNAASSEILISGCNLNALGETTLKIAGKIHDLNEPSIDVNTGADIRLADLTGIIKSGLLKDAGGNAALSCALSCSLVKSGDSSAYVIKSLNVKGTIKINDAGLKFVNPVYDLTDINGEIKIDGNDISVINATLSASGNVFDIKGSAGNFIEFLYRKNQKISVTGTVSSPEMIFDKFAAEEKAGDTSAIVFPEKINADLELSFAKFTYSKFHANDIKSHISYSYPELTIDGYSFKSMKGFMEGRASIKTDSNKKLHVTNFSHLDRIAINELFRSFNNFGQDYIMDKHLKGLVNADLSLSGTITDELKLIDKDLDVAGQLEIINGELNDFGPMMSLSKFIEVSELQNIRFSKLENYITIHNGVITIPSMEINSSAFSITLSGTHDFNQNISYHVRVLLSQVLGGKARKAKKENEEFGVIEDDGLGKTKLYLLISGNVDNYKVSYDTRAAKDALKQNFSNEKKEIKSMLKDEFGLFKKDTSIKSGKKKNAGKKKVMIEWNDEKDEPGNDLPPE